MLANCCAPLLLLPSGVATLRGTLPWIAPEIIHTPASVTQVGEAQQ
jgi:hypothetical protein